MEYCIWTEIEEDNIIYKIDKSKDWKANAKKYI